MLNRLKEEAELLTKQISLMRSTAIELRQKGGEPSDTFKKLLCGKVARLRHIEQLNGGGDGDKQSCDYGQDNPRS